MSVYRNLKPNVHVIELLGGTGNGKTETATVPAMPKARKILLKGVGQTNSTLKDITSKILSYRIRMGIS